MPSEPCQHKNIDTNVEFDFIEDVHRYMACIRIACADCKVPFRFVGLPAGMDYNSPCVSVDARELRQPVAPKGEVISELEGGPQGFTVRKVT